jgi:DNA-binding MarR family transcriptional regulator
LSLRGIAPAPAHAASPRSAHNLLRTGDLTVLRWLAEQYGARADQLLLLLGCSSRTSERTVARLREAGLVRTQRLLASEPPWVIPTASGLRACGQRFGVWRPRLGLLAHVAAVNDVRLHVCARSPESEWVCERLLARMRQDGEHLPDAMVVTDERRVAIEVELTVKSRRRTTEIINELSRRFDAILYFCAPVPHRALTELAANGRWPTLGLRALPAGPSVAERGRSL